MNNAVKGLKGFVVVPITDRMSEKTIIAEQNQCWNWTGCLDGYSYGRIKVNHKSKLAHRIAYELNSGKPLLDSEHVLHRCDNTKCVNPNHLFLGDAASNAADREAKGRGNRVRVGNRFGKQSIKGEHKV